MSDAYARYQRRPGMVLGFHGCDKAVGEDLLAGHAQHLKSSDNLYDWLGSGVYFWENDPQRALEFAREAVGNPRLTKGTIKEPFVIGAVIDLGLCLNLLDRRSLEELSVAYTFLQATQQSLGEEMPANKGADRAARYLDRAVIETLHASRQIIGQVPYDTVRGAFWEGGELYPRACFEKKNHIQVAVRNLHVIKGYFRPFAN